MYLEICLFKFIVSLFYVQKDYAFCGLKKSNVMLRYKSLNIVNVSYNPHIVGHIYTD